MFSGALFAFATSFDEVVVVLFLGSVEQRTMSHAPPRGQNSAVLVRRSR